ncbi:unnamed protein product [Cylicocyclus nassatus]|uniref:Uncharacterized protein n=1 Tax=Cylicocyclus nassatus TaxID=53992 RepID=A0AA36GJE8_CYLNA|nr:unnamed protein product [Cylicocyclus nassatus]
METRKVDEEFDYDDTTETTLSLYSLAPTASFVDVEESEYESSVMDEPDYNLKYWDAMENIGAINVKESSESSGDESLNYPRMSELEETHSTAPYLESKLQKAEEDLKTALSHIDADTALSEISIYSEYTPPPSETNVEIEYDIIAGASPMSTAVGGSVSWYSMPNSETEVEVPTSLYVGGTRVMDSIECMHKLSEAKLQPVVDFGSCVNYLGSGDLGELKTPSEIEEEQFEYSYYSEGPSETNVTMEGVEVFGDDNEADYKATARIQDPETLPVG